jgi:hypothetical protein
VKQTLKVLGVLAMEAMEDEELLRIANLQFPFPCGWFCRVADLCRAIRAACD